MIKDEPSDILLKQLQQYGLGFRKAGLHMKHRYKWLRIIQGRLREHLASVRICQPAAFRAGPDCLRRIPEKNTQTGRHALGAHGYHAWRHLYGPEP